MFRRLSKREIEVIDMLAHGYSAEDVENKLKIKPCTFKTHMNSVYAKFSDILDICKRDSSKHYKKFVIELLYLRHKGVLSEDWYIKV